MKYVIKWFLPYWKEHKLRMSVIILLGLITAFLSAVIPFYIKKIINGFEHNLTRGYLINNVILMLLLSIIHYITNVVSTVNRAYMNYRIEYEARKKLFSHILTLDEMLFAKYSVGDILTRFVDDISEKIAWFSCSGVFRFIQAFFTIASVLIFMIIINIKLTLIVIMPMPFLLYITTRFRDVLSKKYDLLQKSISEMYDFLEVSFAGIKIIKANYKEKKFYKRFEQLSYLQMEKAVDAEKKQMFMRYIFFGIGTLSVFLVYLFGGVSYIKGGNITIGEIVSFQVYTFMMLFPLSDVSQFFVSGHRAKVSIKRIDELLNFKPSLIQNKNYKKIDRVEEIKLVNVSLKINESRILSDINISISSGKKVAVVGKIGSSKSILLKVMGRLIEFDNGNFFVNSIDIRDILLCDYYKKISYISQEPYIITDTILNNITLYGNYPNSEIEKVINISQLEKDLSNMPKGLNTLIGNKGMTISGGQKQRISIARALLKNPEIIFMDDSTNQMDLHTEYLFWEEFEKYFRDITVVFVTHRTFRIEKADEIIVMDNGRIAEYGKHSDLINKDGIYQKVYQRYKSEENYKI